MNVLVLLLVLWLPQGWESTPWLGGEVDACRRIVFNGNVPPAGSRGCTTTYPATWWWSIDDQLVAVVDDFPHVTLTVPPRYGSVISWELEALQTSCRMQGEFVVTREWLEMRNRYPAPRLPCPTEFEEIFADGLEAGNPGAWSASPGYDSTRIFADGFESGNTTHWR